MRQTGLPRREIRKGEWNGATPGAVSYGSVMGFNFRTFVLLRAFSSTYPIIEPGILEATKSGKNKAKANCLSRIGPRRNTVRGTPMRPVPTGSVSAAQSLRAQRNTKPTTIAPGIPPGKAKIVPVPLALRMMPAIQAEIAAYHGPIMTPATTLILFWKGKALMGPTGKWIPERRTAMAANSPARTILRIFPVLSIYRPVRQ